MLHPRFSTLSGLTQHRNTMHPPPNHQAFPVQLLPLAFPSPPNDMDFNDGENNSGPHKAIQGDMQTLGNPILNGMLFIHLFFCFLFIYSKTL